MILLNYIKRFLHRRQAMKVEIFVKLLESEFYTGVPDSQLKALCNYLMNTYGIDQHHHIIAANEGNATAIAAGYYLSTGKIPVVYMQNSGEGNVINPVASLLNKEVYAIPTIFVIGWRGEPEISDEPQHVFQGKVTLKLLEDMDIEYFVLRKDTTEAEMGSIMKHLQTSLSRGKQIAIVVAKDALEYKERVDYRNSNCILREEAIRHIVEYAGDDPIISTTGKASRELFEIRESRGESHQTDFLTVGSMGHSSSIAMEIALQKPETRIWCIDGDGAALMHMGALAVIGHFKPKNMVHILINNEAHETVGGMPTVACDVNMIEIAKACGYPYAVSVKDLENLDEQLNVVISRRELCLIEIKCALGARSDLGRPTTTALENRDNFMAYLKQKS